MAYVENLVLQLHSMVNKKCPHYKVLFKYADFSSVFDLLGKALRAVYVIDSIVNNNGAISEHWDAYKLMVKLSKNEPDKFGTKGVTLKRL